MKAHRNHRRGSRSQRPAVLEACEGRRMFSTYVVTSAADSGPGTLRDAIKAANSHAGADTIDFHIGSGVKTITTKTALPYVGDAVTIDGTTQPGYAGRPIIELNGSQSGGYGLTLGGGNSTVKGLVINRYSSGILLVKAGGDTVKNCYIGTGVSGKTHLGNTDKGIIVQTANNVIGGMTAADRNVISGNGTLGIILYTYTAANNKIQGNYIGTDYTGTADLGNGSGILVFGAPNNLIGGTSIGARNVISGSDRDGIVINTKGATGTVIQGNYIGTDVTGTKRIENLNYGVETSQPNTLVGGATASARNVISGNGYTGVVLWTGVANGCTVENNYIGTDATGTHDLGNYWRGIDVSNGSHDNLVKNNLVSGNDMDGILLYQGYNNTVDDNTIGFDVTRTKPLVNFANGIRITSVTNAKLTNNYIGNNHGYALFHTGGGTLTLSGNVIKNDDVFNVNL